MTLLAPNCLFVGLVRKSAYSSSSSYFCISSRVRGAQLTIQRRRYASSTQSESTPRKKLQTSIAPPKSEQSTPSRPHQAASTQVQSPASTQVQLPGQQPVPAPPEDPINPPISTLPAPVNAPEQKPNQSKIRWLFNVGKAYVGFYKTGVKNVWANRKLEKALRIKARETRQREGMKGSIEELSEHSWRFSITRAEWWTVERSKHDWRRVPIFALILVIFGEWTPLIVVFATPLVPYTCRIPSQIEKSRRKQEERRRRSFRGELQEPISVIGEQSDEVAELRGRMQHVCRSLGLYSSIWDNRMTRNIWPTTTRMENLVTDWVARMSMDDQLLCTAVKTKKTGETLADEDKAAEKAAQLLSLEELKLACENRGIDVLGQPENVLRKILTSWLKISMRSPRTPPEGINYMIEDHHVYRMCLVRPRSWQSWVQRDYR